jgi:hypothetical protein
MGFVNLTIRHLLSEGDEKLRKLERQMRAGSSPTDLNRYVDEWARRGGADREWKEDYAALKNAFKSASVGKERRKPSPLDSNGLYTWMPFTINPSPTSRLPYYYLDNVQVVMYYPTEEGLRNGRLHRYISVGDYNEGGDRYKRDPTNGEDNAKMLKAGAAISIKVQKLFSDKTLGKPSGSSARKAVAWYTDITHPMQGPIQRRGFNF